VLGALDGHRERDHRVDVGARVGLVEPSAAARVPSDGVGGVARQLGDPGRESLRSTIAGRRRADARIILASCCGNAATS
jgi:hypothetical protein